MANNVEIIVEASVAGALAKLNLVEHELHDVGDAGGVTAKKLGDENDRSSLAASMGRVERHLSNFTSSSRYGLGAVENGFRRVGLAVLRGANYFDRGASAAGKWISGIADGVPVIGRFADIMGSLVSGLGSLVAALSPAAVGVGILTAAFIVLDTILNAAATVIGTVVAVIADLVAPITLVTGLLGGLGVAFVLAAKKAFGDGGALAPALDQLKHKFDTLTSTLADRFMPVFRFLATEASHALDYLNRIAKLPLAEAFRNIATVGVPAVAKFIGQVGSMLARPFRLAVQIAFGKGKGGNEIASAVSGLWKQFTDFLLGYTVSHPIRLHGRVIQIQQRTVDGALQPFLDWFNRHHFTRQGEKIGREILKGLQPLAKPLGQFIVHVLEQAAIQSARDMLNIYRAMWDRFHDLAQRAHNAIIGFAKHAASSMAQAITSAVTRAWNAVMRVAQHVWNSIGSVGRNAVRTLVAIVAGPLVGAWAGVRGAVNTIIGLINTAKGAVDGLIGILNHALDIANAVVNAVSLGHSTSTAGRTGQGGNSPGAPRVLQGANVAGNVAGLGGNVAVIHIHGADLTSAEQRRVVGAQLGDTLMRRWAQQAGR